MHRFPDWRRRSAIAVLLLCGALAGAPVHAADTYGPVSQAETLWAVAQKLVRERRSGTTAQMAWALYQANPAAFEGSPSRIRAGATLAIPDAAAVQATAPQDAYARLTGAPPPAPAPGTTPEVTGAALQPRVEGDPHQWLVVTGSGFAPGARLEFRDLGGGRALPEGRPQSVREGRIEYAAGFPAAPARWQAVVRNPGGQRSAPFAFDVGGSAAEAQVAAPLPGGRFEGSPDQQALLEKVRAGAPAEERYRLLAALEDRYAGDVDYDYPFGTLALDTGRFSEAVFILQRAVARRPAFSGARMELARAYYALGDNESARREFRRLQREDPPAEAQRAIAQYLEAIDQRSVSYAAQRGFYAELASGYDSNANGAPDIQNFIGFNLDSRNQATASGYYGIGLGGAFSRPLGPAWRAVGSGAASHRGHPDASFVDSQALRLGGGLEWRPAKWMLSLAPNGAYVMLDGEENHQVLGVDGAAAWGTDDAQLALNLRYAQQRYADVLSVQDVDALLYGVSSQSRLRGLPRVLFSAAVTAGTEEAVEDGSPFGRDLLGVRAGATVNLGRGVLLLSMANLDSDYDSVFFVGEPRSDDQFSALLGYESLRWREAGWTLRAQVSYVDNASTVALYDYHRYDAGVVVRREFK